MFHVENTTIDRIPVIIITSDDELSFKIVVISCIYNFCERLYDGNYEYIQKFYWFNNQGFGNENYFITVSADDYSDALNKIASRINSVLSLDGYPTRVSVNIDGHGSGAHLDLILPDGDYSSFPKFTCETLLVQPLNVDFDTDLYQELLNNEEQFSLAKSFLNDIDPSKELDPNYWTDIQLKFFNFVEEYNKNVLLLRSTRKVNIENTINTSSSSSVNLTGVETKLQNINNSLDNIKDNLQYTNTDDVTKGLAQIEYDKDNSVLVQNNLVESAPYNPHLQKNDLYEG